MMNKVQIFKYCTHGGVSQLQDVRLIQKVQNVSNPVNGAVD